MQARYAYSFAQRIEEIRHDRSNLDIEVGYVLTPRVRVFAISAGQKTHGGIDTRRLRLEGPARESRASITIGSRAWRCSISAAACRSACRSHIEVFGSFMTTTAGRNSHALARGLTLGVSWGFGGGLPRSWPRRLRQPNRSRSSSGASARSRPESSGRRLKAHTNSIERQGLLVATRRRLGRHVDRMLRPSVSPDSHRPPREQVSGKAKNFEEPGELCLRQNTLAARRKAGRGAATSTPASGATTVPAKGGTMLKRVLSWVLLLVTLAVRFRAHGRSPWIDWIPACVTRVGTRLR